MHQVIQRSLLTSGALALLVLGSVVSVYAQARLEARYSATIAGVPIGNGSWTIDITDTQYTAVVNGTTSGLLRAFTGGQGNATARGTLNGGQLLSSIYVATIGGRKKIDSIRITIHNGNVKDFKVDPPLDNDPERVPLTEASQRGVFDPMTASLVRMPGQGNLLAPEACQRTLEIFDGRLRYDIQFAFKRMDKVKAGKGYAGPVVVCAAYFTPVAGFVPSRAAIKYLSKQREMEVWLAPIAGTRVLVPYRAQGPTPIGQAALEASEFVSVSVPAGTSANGSKTQ
ncbi:MAG TPA: DUF3108 domain-containing protein [Pseudolabrys sp.]|nr:DUF3108 domain-containing protein [Pseudolabrys sp.]